MKILGFSHADFRSRPHCYQRRMRIGSGCADLAVVRAPHQRRSRADPSFVTQLIASGELIPQTCAVQRATSTAYRSTANRNRMTVTGSRIRHSA
jgi:hypothetical protein